MPDLHKCKLRMNTLTFDPIVLAVGSGYRLTLGRIALVCKIMVGVLPAEYYHRYPLHLSVLQRHFVISPCMASSLALLSISPWPLT